MGVDRYLVRRILRNPRRARGIVQKRIRALAWERYARQIRDPKVIVHPEYQSSFLDGREDERKRIDATILSSRVPYQDLVLTASGFEQFMTRAAYRDRYPEYASYYASMLYEKVLQHYAAALLLKSAESSVDSVIYMDVGSEDSVAPDIYRRLYGWQVYRQDLAYRPGIHGEYVGGDAGNLPLPDESIHLMALHCAYEHFEGDSDVGLIREAQRVLKPRGRLVIVPLYLSDRDRIMTDPVVSVPAGVVFPDGVEVVCIPRWWNRFGRLYSVRALEDRVLSQWTCGQAWLVRFLNSGSLHAQCHLAYGLVLEKQCNWKG